MSSIYSKSSMSTSINNKLYMLRVQRHYTQAQVAEMAGLTRPYYTKVENGQCIASVKTYKKIARALSIVDWKQLIPYSADGIL